MFGLVKSEVRTLGGEVIKSKKRRLKIILVVTMILGFILVNGILYYLANI